MSKTTDRIGKAIEQTAQKMGYQIVDIEIGKENGNKVLTVFISHPGGVGLDDCEAVSRAIDPIIDELDPIEDAYYLCVSSPGIDRPLKRTADFISALGKLVEVKLYHAVDGHKIITGILETFDENTDFMKIRVSDNKEYEFERKDVARVKPVANL